MEPQQDGVGLDEAVEGLVSPLHQEGDSSDTDSVYSDKEKKNK